MRAVAEGKAHGEFLAIIEIDLADDGDVAVLRAIELPIEPEVVAQVLPAVARADESAGCLQEIGIDAERETGAIFPRDQDLLARRAVAARGVAPSAAVEMRREQHVDLQSVRPLRFAFDARVNQHARPVRVGDDLLDDAIAPLRVARHDAITERVAADAVDLASQITLLLVKEAFSIGDQELQVPDLRMVDRGVIDFVQDAVREREPDAARIRVRGADPFLRARGPARRNARMPESLHQCCDRSTMSRL